MQTYFVLESYNIFLALEKQLSVECILHLQKKKKIIVHRKVLTCSASSRMAINSFADPQSLLVTSDIEAPVRPARPSAHNKFFTTTNCTFTAKLVTQLLKKQKRCISGVSIHSKLQQ